MRRLGLLGVLALLPVAGFAQEAVIRIEAKRGEAAAIEAAAAWRDRFDEVVTFPLPRGWFAIGLGPFTAEEAAERLASLQAAGQIPADSFVAEPGSAVPLRPVTEAAPEPETAATETLTTETLAPETLAPEAVVAAQPDIPAPGTHIRLQSLQSETDAATALQDWRKTFPEAGLWALPGGWYSVTVGPMAAPTAQAWLEAFKASGDLPRDAFTSDSAELGRVVEAGRAPDLPAPGAPAEMPPLEEVQRALRWAGHYDGAIDGKTGPRTRDAIAAEVAALRVSPDAGTSMRRLIERREAWREEMGLTVLQDEITGLQLSAPMDRLVFDRAERSLSIYGPKDGSGAALILFSQPGGQQELLDLTGLVTALGWVPQPDRLIERGHVLLAGANDDHIGRAEGWVRDGRAEGFVLIWPSDQREDQARIAADMSDSFARFAPAANDPATPAATDP